MLFDIFEYNVSLALVSFCIFLIILLFSFKEYLTSIADPLLLHILWLSSQFTFFIIFINKYEASTIYLFFLFGLTLYTLALFYFIKLFSGAKLAKADIIFKSNIVKNKTLLDRWNHVVIILLFLYLYSINGFLIYAFNSNNFTELFLYKYVDLQGRNPIERIFSISFYFLTFYLLHGVHLNHKRKTSIVVLFILITQQLLSGGRAALLVFVFLIGNYILLFPTIIKKEFMRKFNRLVLVFITISMAASILISTYYLSNFNIEDGFFEIFNRVFAAPDGVEYYLKHAGELNIESGILPYLNSIFGIYIKNIFNQDYKNIGWQLLELASGDVAFAQGPNYTFLLQSAILHIASIPFYSILIAWLIAKCRYLPAHKSNHVCFIYVISFLAFNLATDIEYFVFLLMSTTLIQIIILYLHSLKIKR